MEQLNSDLPRDQRNQINEYIEERLSKLFKTIGVSSIASLLFGIGYLFIYVPNFAATDIENKVTLRILSAGSKLDNMRSELLQSIGKIEQSVLDTGSDLDLAKAQLQKLLSEVENTEEQSKTRLEDSIVESSERIKVMISSAESRVESTIEIAQTRISEASDELDNAIANNNVKILGLGNEIISIEQQLEAQKKLLLSISDDEISGLAQLAKEMSGYKDVQSILNRLSEVELRVESFATKLDIDELSKEIRLQADYFIMHRKSITINDISDLDGRTICIASSVDAENLLERLELRYSIKPKQVEDPKKYGWIALYKANTCNVYLDYEFNLGSIQKVANSDRHTTSSIRF